MRRILTSWSVFMVLILTSCGGAATPTTDIHITLVDFQFSPNSFTVPAGEEIALSAVNNGAVIHNFIIMEMGYQVGNEFDEEDQPHVYWQTDISPGNSIETSFTAPQEPGEYEVVCSTPGHVQAGMVGTLNVVVPE